MQDLVALLLHGAMQASHALDELRRLAQLSPADEPTALTEVIDAITTMTSVRSALIRDADRLIEGRQVP